MRPRVRQGVCASVLPGAVFLPSTLLEEVVTSCVTLNKLSATVHTPRVCGVRYLFNPWMLLRSVRLCRAIAAAHAAEPAMKALGSWQRKAILMHCVEQFKARKDELAMALCIEAGKPIKVAACPHSTKSSAYPDVSCLYPAPMLHFVEQCKAE